MSDTALVEIYEIEVFERKKWEPDEEHPWLTKQYEDCKPLDELPLPSAEWSWSSNWKIDKKPGETDNQGWVYARSLKSFQDANYVPHVEKSWSDKSRRRLWSRMMRKELVSPNAGGNGSLRSRSASQDMSKTLPRIQQVQLHMGNKFEMKYLMISDDDGHDY